MLQKSQTAPGCGCSHHACSVYSDHWRGLTLIFSNIVNEIWRLAREFPSAQKVMQYIEIIFAKTQDFFLDLPPDIEQSIRDALGSFVGNIASYLQRLLNYIMGIARFLPQFFLFIIISLVASFFMSRDRERFPALYTSRYLKTGELKSVLLKRICWQLC